jgi:hypothetical protein
MRVYWGIRWRKVSRIGGRKLPSFDERDVIRVKNAVRRRVPKAISLGIGSISNKDTW